jgi:exopolyphosphatase/guanosine-5'-triphosphate,3'-diphosphate pyrophosphatase
LIFCQRLAAVLHRARDDAPLPEINVGLITKGFQLQFDRNWLANAPLTAAVLQEETLQWANVGIDFKLRASRLAG